MAERFANTPVTPRFFSGGRSRCSSPWLAKERRQWDAGGTKKKKKNLRERLDLLEISFIEKRAQQMVGTA